MLHRALMTPRVLVALAISTAASGLAADYTFVPDKKDGTAGSTAISFTAPASWVGWKDDSHYFDRTDPFSRMLVESALTVGTSLSPLNCEPNSTCPTLTIDTFARESSAPPDINTALRRQATELWDPAPEVRKFGSFDTARAGVLTIWRARCEKCENQLVTLVALGDVVAMISLQGPDQKQTVAALDSLKELARSARISPATFTSPDMITVDARQSPAAIRQQLLELTPLGSAKETVYSILDRRIRKEPDAGKPGLSRRRSDFEVHLGWYDNPPGNAPAALGALETDRTHVNGVWRFGRDQKLREIDVRTKRVRMR